MPNEWQAKQSKCFGSKQAKKKIDNSRYNVPMPERDEPDQISMKQI